MGTKTPWSLVQLKNLLPYHIPSESPTKKQKQQNETTKP